MDAATILLTVIPMILIVFVPGFFLSLAVFPKKEDLDGLERSGLSLLFGLSPFLLLYFTDKNFAIPITNVTTYLAVVLLSIVGAGIYLYRIGKFK